MRARAPWLAALLVLAACEREPLKVNGEGPKDPAPAPLVKRTVLVTANTKVAGRRLVFYVDLENPKEPIQKFRLTLMGPDDVTFVSAINQSAADDAVKPSTRVLAGSMETTLDPLPKGKTSLTIITAPRTGGNLSFTISSGVSALNEVIVDKTGEHQPLVVSVPVVFD